jgi:hypothetical protein
MNYRRWIAVLSIALCGVGWATSGNVYAEPHVSDGYTIDDLDLNSAGDLVDVCTLEMQHAHYNAARAFCYGFFEGAIHYNNAISNEDYYVDLVCSPAGITRLQGVQVFLAYMAANPQYETEAPIDAIFRALIAEWPCTE